MNFFSSKNFAIYVHIQIRNVLSNIIIVTVNVVQIAYVLSNLERFFGEIEPEVEAISGEESDTQAFMKLMSIFNRVR